MSIDFAKQRENLTELASYIQQKQTNSNNAQLESAEIPGMQLAEQKEVQSDTLAPESVLSTETVATEVPETMDVQTNVPAEVQTVQDNQGIESVEPQIQVDAFAQVAQAPGVIPAPEPNSETIIANAQPSEGTMLDTSATNLGGETTMGETGQGTEVASEVSAMPEAQPEVGAVETPGVIPTPEPNPDTTIANAQPGEGAMLDTSAANLGGETTAIGGAEMISGSEGIQPQPAEMASAPEPMPVPEAVTQIPEINNDGTQTELNGEMQADEGSKELVMPADGMNTDLSQIPDISVANLDVPSDQPETYVATGTGASTEIADVTPVQAENPVVMPNGVTPDMANNPDLVVGPESFGGPSM